jgi:hypothetical protein
MKINFAKCELILFNISSDLGSCFASQLGCRLGTLSIIYLDFPFHNKMLTIVDWNFLIEKNSLNLGLKKYYFVLWGETYFVEFCHFIHPLYWLAFYKFLKSIILRIDKLRKRFL